MASTWTDKTIPIAQALRCQLPRRHSIEQEYSGMSPSSTKGAAASAIAGLLSMLSSAPAIAEDVIAGQARRAQDSWDLISAFSPSEHWAHAASSGSLKVPWTGDPSTNLGYRFAEVAPTPRQRAAGVSAVEMGWKTGAAQPSSIRLDVLGACLDRAALGNRYPDIRSAPAPRGSFDDEPAWQSSAGDWQLTFEWSDRRTDCVGAITIEPVLPR